MIAALFPGQGSQSIGMAKDFYENSRAAKAVLDEAEEALPGLLDIMWQGPTETLQLTANQQPALVVAGAAAYAAYLEAGGAAPSYGAGHSLGEFTAHVASTALTVSQAVRLVRKRGEYMQSAVPEGVGAMAAIMKLEQEKIAAVCAATPGVVELANLNALEQTVISGEAKAVEAASETLKAQGARVIPLKVSAPFHCSLMKSAAEALAKDLALTNFTAPSFTIICNVNADVLTDVRQAADLLEQQVTSPVRWVESVIKFKELGVTKFLEFGSGKVLTGLVGRILGEVDARAVVDMASLREAV
ncbi:MAG: ACP S-malonyltransferase [Trueperaceae bacterium]